MRARDRALSLTVHQYAADLIVADNTANIVVCLHNSVKDTVQQNTAVIPNDTANHHRLPCRLDRALYFQVGDHRRFLCVIE